MLIIAERGQPTPYSLIVNSYARIYQMLKDEGFLFAASQSIDEILKNHLGREFTIVDGRWWFTNPMSVPFIDRVPLAERVERMVVDTLRREVKLSFNDILQRVYIEFPNARTPETRTVQEVLKDYGEKTPDKKWRLKPSVAREESKHDTLVEYVSKIGDFFGFNVIADVPGRRVKTLPFKCENPDRVREIDAIWLKDDLPVYEFEIENTTGISSGIDRGSNLKFKGLKRVIVIPEERKVLLRRKFREQKFSDELNEYGWTFIYYSEVSMFLRQTQGRKKPSLSSFDKSLLSPDEIRIEIQAKLDG